MDLTRPWLIPLHLHSNPWASSDSCHCHQPAPTWALWHSAEISEQNTFSEGFSTLLLTHGKSEEAAANLVSEQVWETGSLLFLVINSKVRYWSGSDRVQDIAAYSVRCMNRKGTFASNHLSSIRNAASQKHTISCSQKGLMDKFNYTHLAKSSALQTVLASLR